MEQIEASLRIIAVVVPVALYFLLLGMLNTRRRPQLLSGRQDTALLMVALSPLAFQPLTALLGGGPAVLLGAAGVVAAVILLAPQTPTLVVYNLSIETGRSLAAEILEGMGHSVRKTQRGVEFEDTAGVVEISAFPLLRNLTFRLTGGRKDLWKTFEHHLAERLGRIETSPHPMSVGLLLVATGLFVAPLAAIAHHGPEIVRLLTDLIR
jgi:hypothetical protein